MKMFSNMSTCGKHSINSHAQRCRGKSAPSFKWKLRCQVTEMGFGRINCSLNVSGGEVIKHGVAKRDFLFYCTTSSALCNIFHGIDFNSDVFHFDFLFAF